MITRARRLLVWLAMLGPSHRWLSLLLPLCGLCGCSSDTEFTTDVSGDYAVAITNGPSNCSDFKDWVLGATTKDPIQFGITQSNQSIHGTAGGGAGLFFKLWLGSAEFDGSISGNSLTLTNYGQRAHKSGNCSYTYNVNVKGTQTGDSISGTITYAPQTNGNPDCNAVECSASQEFSGSRPPR